MDIKEALTFLELSSEATEQEIKQRLQDKLAHFENLSENSPSDFLRRVNALHAAKVKKMQEEFKSLKFKIAKKDPLPPDQTSQPVEVEPKPETETGDTVPLNVDPKSKKKLIDEPAGWLITHNKDVVVKPFSLFAGKIYIGRKQQPGFTPFILVEDAFVSRVHAVLHVEPGEPFTFYIEDTDDSNRGKASKNGTYLNGNANRIKKTKLKDDDTIQVGITKFVFRLNTTTIEKIMEEVIAKDYMHTVAIAQ